MPTNHLRLPGILLGLGLGGFVDGILLHQILQWHHMLSSTPQHPPTTVAGLEVNTLWDGLFHAATWLFVVAGLLLLWRAVRQADTAGPLRALLGWILMGWGIFNLVEGIVDHQILQIHHVRPGPYQTAYDIGFLLLGALLVWVGRATAASASPPGAGR